MAKGYNGWKNWETWNVALWINNDEGLYNLAKECNDYSEMLECIRECASKTTPDGCHWDDDRIDFREINDMILDIR